MSTDDITSDLTRNTENAPPELLTRAFFFLCAALSIVTTVSIVLAGLAAAYDPRRGLNLPSRVVAELYIDGHLVTWGAEAGWLETCILGEWDPVQLVQAVAEYSEDLGFRDD